MPAALKGRAQVLSFAPMVFVRSRHVPAACAWLMLCAGGVGCSSAHDGEAGSSSGAASSGAASSATVVTNDVEPEGTASTSAQASQPATAATTAVPITREVNPEPVAGPITQRLPYEPSNVSNAGVWIHAAGTISNAVTFSGLAHGTGSEWEYLATNALPSYGRAGIGGTGDDDLWLVNTSATHFDGSVFAPAHSPWDLSNVHLGLEMGDVWANSTNDVWAAVGPSSLTLAEVPLAHFDGSSWRTVDEIVDAVDVWASGPADVWVLNNAGEVWQFDGTQWHLHPVIGPTLWGTSPDDVWVGMRWHYSEGEWTEINLPEDAPGWPRLWGAGPDDVWALDMSTGTPKFHFDGQAWNERVSAPSAGGGGISVPTADIFGRASDDIWVVGGTSVPANAASGAGEAQGAIIRMGLQQGRVLHYDGQEWTDVTPPLLQGAYLTRVWVAPDGD